MLLPRVRLGNHWFLKNRSVASKPELCHGIQPQGHPITRSESNLNLALPGVFGILTHAQPCPDSAGIPGGTLPSPVRELLLSVPLHLSDKSAEDPGQRRAFLTQLLRVKSQPPSNNECHKQRNWLWISLLCFYVQGELGFWLHKDWSSACISFEYFVVACSADFSFSGCMRKWYDIVW